LTCENNASENSNTPTIAPSAGMAFLARAIFHAEFIEPPCEIETTKIPKERAYLLEKSPPEKDPKILVSA
jgi:hypothetical protein